MGFNFHLTYWPFRLRLDLCLGVCSSCPFELLDRNQVEVNEKRVGI